MRMRIGVLWSAGALALLAVSSALRTPQVEGVARTSRRLPAPTAPESNSFSTDSPDSVPTYRSRSSRKREETPRDVVRTRTRNMPDTTEQAAEPERPSGNNERFDSRRTRTRRPIETPRAETNGETFRNAATRSRSRPTARRLTTQTPEVSSPTINEKKIEVFNTNVDDLSKIATKQDNTANSQFRRRNSISQTTEAVAPRRGRGRINTRPSARALDLDSSGSTNSILIVDKAPTTARTSADLRNVRKLRYKTRPSETESNLTGDGIVALNEVKSSQTENITSQPETQTAAAVSVEKVVQSTEPNKPKSTTLKVTRVVRRPLTRGKATHTPFVTAPKKKSDDINEDDNYPESFKALIQAKNATQTSSPMTESLSVKASQKVFKTYSTSSQSTQTGPAENKYSRLQKQKAEESNKPTIEEESIATTMTPEVTSQSSEYKLRGKYSARNKKSTTFRPAATTASSVSQVTEKNLSKYSRKFKLSTNTEAPRNENNDKSKRIETTSGLRKPAIRPSFYSRKSGKNTVTSTEVSVSVSERKEEIAVRKKVSLPRTSYYSRLRNKTETTTTTQAAKKEILDVAQKKTEDIADMPLIFTLFNNSENKELVSDSLKKVETENTSEPFIISVSSTESQENMLANEVTSNLAEESEDTLAVSPTVETKQDTDRQKYHANFKNANRNVIDNNTRAFSTVPPVRNLQRRRQRTRQKEKIENSPVTTTERSQNRNVRKFSEAFSKTTEASNNGILAETEKAKSRFSSKYRASYLNKPFYKPTVPTITSSTAWLKFFVTDHLLTQSVEEPNWFEEHVDETTESFANATSPYIHPSSIKLVEGEEMQLGPDNAISITQTRRTLSSADLRLSESLLKSSQVMNVEASHHSPSVTVSIFDALAEILTSTPKTRLSSTTEVTTKPNLNTDVTQILNGVSNIVNVNSAGGITSSDAFVPASARSTITQSVQNTVQTTPNVINNMSAGENVTPSLNAEVVTPVNTPQTPIPTPTTPVSARRPFAIKVLYSNTESPTDKPSTASDLTSIQPTTDNPRMVYNTVSDLLLSSNNLVSSELTSMLSNNIRSIIQNMDEDSRSRISVDMAKLLKSLIPRAINGQSTALDNTDFIPNTTPYSLEDIKDTENIDVNINLSSFDILQSITTDNSVNNAGTNSNPVTNTVVVTDNPESVNKIDVTQGPILESSSQTTSADLSVTEKVESRAAFEILPSTTSSSNMLSSTEAVTSSDLLDIQTDNVNNNSSTSTNNTAPLPFLTNFQVNDFTPSDLEVNNLTKSLPLNQKPVGPPRDRFDINVQDPSQVSPLQLWVLSKKASVLKMIEDLIRQHNTELATAPTFAEFISTSNKNINLSERLTNIMNTMTLTTESLTETTKSDLSFTTTSILNTVPLSTTVPSIQTDRISSGDSDDGSLTFNTPGLLASQDGLQPITTETTDFSLRFGFDNENGKTDETSTTESTTRNTLVTPVITTEQMQNQDANTANSFTTTTIQENTETTTASANTETTTQINTETTAFVNDGITTQTDSETTTDGNVVTNQNFTQAVPLSAATPTIPKKDYVIFGILPNNTVVRKDPNDDALESLTEASPYIIYGLLPNNTVIRKFPNGTRVPRIMQKIDILPISPWNLRNPYSPIHNIPAIVRPQPNPIRVSTNTVTSTDITNNGTDTVNNQETMISSSALNIKSSSLGITTVTNKSPAEISTASHVLSLRTTTMLPSIDEILLNSLSSAAKQEMVISSMTSSTREPTILTLDIDPETKQIRTERPGDGDGNTVFKFIPIDEVMVKQHNSNVLKLATKAPSTTNTDKAEVQIETVTTMTEVNTKASQTQAYTNSASTTAPETSVLTNTPVITTESTTVLQTTEATTVALTTTQAPTTTLAQTTTQAATTLVPTTTQVPTTTLATTTAAPATTQAPTTTQATTTTPQMPTTTIAQAARTTIQTLNFDDEIKKYQPSQSVQNTARDPKYLNVQSFNNLLTAAESGTTTRIVPITAQQNDPTALLQALLSATGNKNTGTLSIPNLGGNIRVTSGVQTTTSRSIQDDIRQFEEDTKLLKALLAATGQNPANLNIPSLDAILTTTRAPTTEPPTTTAKPTTTTARPTTTTTRPTTTQATTTSQIITTPSLQDDLKQFQEDAKLLQALLQATSQNTGNLNIPDISRVTSNVRIASNPLTTQIGSNPTTPLNARPIFATTNGPVFKTFAPRTLSTTTEVSTTEDVRISTTFTPFTQRRPTTVRNVETGTLSGRQAPSRFTVTTETPSSSTFSVQEDLAFLQNLKSVLNTNTGDEDPETALANRIISLAVDRSLTEIQTGNSDSGVRTGKTIANSANNLIPRTTTTTTTSTTPSTTTTQSTTTQQATTTNVPGGPSIDDDIKQFQEDTKLLQALLKATGQDPAKFNIPTLPIITSTTVSPISDGLLLTLPASPSPHHDATPKPSVMSTVMTDKTLPFGAKIAVKDELRTMQDDRTLLKTLIKLQDAQETTTFRSKLAITGQTSDEALKKLIQQQKATGMVSEATKSPISLSTEFGKSNDALLAALLKEQGFGPTTASSIDEQLRLAALLNQVVVTPKARRTTTPPPPPAPRRPILDGLAWLWQQWRETGPGPSPSQRPGPAPSVRPSEATSNRVNWFGSGPFTGNADDRPASSNRIPLEPPRAVTSEQTPGRGQLVSAAINVTRAFSQFLGAAIQVSDETIGVTFLAQRKQSRACFEQGNGQLETSILTAPEGQASPGNLRTAPNDSEFTNTSDWPKRPVGRNIPDGHGNLGTNIPNSHKPRIVSDSSGNPLIEMDNYGKFLMTSD